MLEPSRFSPLQIHVIILSGEKSLEDLTVTANNFTFEEFNQMKLRWLSNLDFIWLIEGHLTEQDALKTVLVTEQAIKFDRISHEIIPHQSRLV